VTLNVRRSHNASRDPCVVDAAPARALEEGEQRPVVGIEHHLLRVARISAHDAAVAEPDMGHPDGDCYTAQQHDLVARIELIGFPGCQIPNGRLSLTESAGDYRGKMFIGLAIKNPYSTHSTFASRCVRF